LSRAEADLRVIAQALAVANCHADAIRFLGYAGLVAHDVPEKLAAAEARMRTAQPQKAVKSKVADPSELRFSIPASGKKNERAERNVRPARRSAYLAASG
jgi:hypothetical protein